MTSAGRSFRPVPSEKTNPTRTTSPRLQAVIRGILRVVPELRQDRIRLRGEAQHFLALVAEVLPDAHRDGLQDVLAHRETALGRGEPQTSAYLRDHVDADTWTLGRRLHSSCHVRSPLQELKVARWCHGVKAPQT